jgi:drug/metabolite transporter (DMT)-like permease
LVLALLARRSSLRGGNWWSALALFIYAAAFSLAYRTLTAGTGALLLFGAVQLTMILAGWRAGEKLRAGQGAGLALALGGLVVLVLPGLSAPPVSGAALMSAAGVAWGVYSLRGRGVTDPLSATAGNFLRAAPLGLLFCLLMLWELNGDAAGILYAVASGALASGLGYAVWYTALRGLTATRAATAQLSVPLIAALGGIFVLGEPFAWRLALAGGAILGGIALVVYEKQ